MALMSEWRFRSPWVPSQKLKLINLNLWKSTSSDYLTRSMKEVNKQRTSLSRLSYATKPSFFTTLRKKNTTVQAALTLKKSFLNWPKKSDGKFLPKWTSSRKLAFWSKSLTGWTITESKLSKRTIPMTGLESTISKSKENFSVSLSKTERKLSSIVRGNQKTSWNAWI